MSIVPEYWGVAKQYLRSVDAVIGQLIDEYEEPPLSSKDELFETLVHSIVGQQISAIAADAIWKRMGLLVDLKIPASYAEVSDQVLRDGQASTLSYKSARYVFLSRHRGLTPSLETCSIRTHQILLKRLPMTKPAHRQDLQIQ